MNNRKPPPPREPLPPPPPMRTPEDAMREFEYACRTWFACMELDDRGQAIRMAVEIEFGPNRPPRSA